MKSCLSFYLIQNHLRQMWRLFCIFTSTSYTSKVLLLTHKNWHTMLK